MASDIKLNGNTVVVEGNVGIGTSNPVRMLHVEGSEIHSGGSASGFSFSDRMQGNEKRWLWYAQGGAANLWSQERGEDAFYVQSNGFVQVKGDLDVKGLIRGTVTGLRGLDLGAKPVRVFVAADAIQLQRDMSITKPAKYALASELALTNKDLLVVNYQNSYKEGVRIEGNVHVTGTFTHASSLTLKENVAELSGQEAMAALQGLNAVKYNYKADETKEQRLGFIAEEVPDLVASPARDRLSPMDIIAVLTKAVQEQQRTIADLATQVNTLKQRKAH